MFEDARVTDTAIVKKLTAAQRDFIKIFQKSLRGETGETKIAPLPEKGPQMIFLGLGKKSDWNTRKYILFVRRAVQILKSEKISDAALIIDEKLVPKQEPLEHLAQTTAENIHLAEFSFTKYKKTPRGGWPRIKRIEIYFPSTNKNIMRAFSEGSLIGECINNARELVNTPGGEITPASLARAAQSAGKTYGFRTEVLNEKKIRALKMGGVIGVCQGSKERPRFIVMRYNKSYEAKPHNISRGPLVLVGKGVTFDTGGLNIKPDEHMYEMHMDMSGGAAVISAMSIIAKLKLPLNIIGLVPAVENMLSGESYRPGDILKTLNGTTIEVLNTDAEGRIILADALGYAVKYLDPALIVDVATLTGAAGVALGQRASAVFTNRDHFEAQLRDIGETSGDYVWPLPTWSEYDEDIKGTFGDWANTGKTRYGGAITAAAFLKQFVGDKPWVHLDIAPTMTSFDGQFLAKGSAGPGVRFLVELARRFPELPIQ